jgi:pimeloyl-ACP methyl ester carboxylesterase
VQLSYFGSAERQLLGVYHPPTGAAEREAAVLVCPPAPQEYMWAHRALRQLASRLCASGFHVFRFDYFGTGDSAGASAEGDLEQWRLDVRAALDELRDVSGVRRPSVVGFRLGATLAAQACERVRDLVLWEPVLRGSELLEELRAMHELQFAHALYPPRLPARGPLHELLGVPLPPRVEAALAELELRPPVAGRPERVFVVAAHDDPRYAELANGIAAAGPRAAFEHVPDSVSTGALFLMATRGQERIVSLLRGRS